MKKVLILLLLLIVVLSSHAQNRQTIMNTHEVRLGVGFAPVYRRIGHNILNDENYSQRELYSKTRVYSPAVNATYSHRFTRRFALDATVSYVSSHEQFYDLYSDDKLSVDNLTRLSIVPVCRFYWNKPSKLVSVYSSIGLGVVFIINKNISGYEGANSLSIRPIFHFSPIGISVGRQVFGFAELGISGMGVLHVGVGYRFNYKK